MRFWARLSPGAREMLRLRANKLASESGTGGLYINGEAWPDHDRRACAFLCLAYMELREEFIKADREDDNGR